MLRSKQIRCARLSSVFLLSLVGVSFLLLVTAASWTSPPTEPIMQENSTVAATGLPEITAGYTPRAIRLDAARPENEWQAAEAAVFATDWRGEHADPERETSVRVLWSTET